MDEVKDLLIRAGMPVLLVIRHGLQLRDVRNEFQPQVLRDKGD